MKSLRASSEKTREPSSPTPPPPAAPNPDTHRRRSPSPLRRVRPNLLFVLSLVFALASLSTLTALVFSLHKQQNLRLELEREQKTRSELQAQLDSIRRTLEDQEARLKRKIAEFSEQTDEEKKPAEAEPFYSKKAFFEGLVALPHSPENTVRVKPSSRELNLTELQKEYLKKLNRLAMLSEVSPDGRKDLSRALTVNGVPVISKLHHVDEHYAPGLNEEASAAFEEMQKAAQKEGIPLVAFSSYRSYEDQKYTFANWKAGDPDANRYSSREGQSEHQSGLAFDINDRASNFLVSPSTEWLANNAYKYGFTLRYPEGKEEITGYIYEPWHYRYVGKEIAADIGPRNTLTLEEYFRLISPSMLKDIDQKALDTLNKKLEEAEKAYDRKAKEESEKSSMTETEGNRNPQQDSADPAPAPFRPAPAPTPSASSSAASPPPPPPASSGNSAPPAPPPPEPSKGSDPDSAVIEHTETAPVAPTPTAAPPPPPPPPPPPAPTEAPVVSAS